MKFVGEDHITCQNGKESSQKKTNQILLSHNQPQLSPYFFVHSFRWNQTTMS